MMGYKIMDVPQASLKNEKWFEPKTSQGFALGRRCFRNFKVSSQPPELSRGLRARCARSVKSRVFSIDLQSLESRDSWKTLRVANETRICAKVSTRISTASERRV